MASKRFVAPRDRSHDSFADFNAPGLSGDMENCPPGDVGKCPGSPPGEVETGGTIDTAIVTEHVTAVCRPVRHPSWMKLMTGRAHFDRAHGICERHHQRHRVGRSQQKSLFLFDRATAALTLPSGRAGTNEKSHLVRLKHGCPLRASDGKKKSPSLRSG